MSITLLHGDCLALLPTLPAASVDLVLADLPYGRTDCAWDSVLPLDALWKQYKRLLRPHGAVVLTATQPFASVLVTSNLAWFRCEWIWNKAQSGGFATAKYHPLRIHESVLVFGPDRVTYLPEMRRGRLRWKGGCTTPNAIQSGLKPNYRTQSDQYYPVSILDFSNAARTGKQHPTQKPVALMAYLIRTYTDPGAVVLDNTMGSGTTGVACVQEGRAFIGMEQDAGYFAIAQQRIAAAQPPLLLEDTA